MIKQSCQALKPFGFLSRLKHTGAVTAFVWPYVFKHISLWVRIRNAIAEAENILLLTPVAAHLVNGQVARLMAFLKVAIQLALNHSV